MEKGKRMNKIIPIIAVIVVVAAVGTIAFIQFRPKPIVVGAAELEKMPVSTKADRAGIGESEEMMDNQEYVENQVVAVAESKREAKKIAKQIGGELLSYDNQVAVIQIGMTVEEMMQKLEEDSTLPRVYPNYQGYQNYTN